MLMMCLAALVVLQVVQLALESSLSLEDNQGFVSISFIIGELHHSRMMLFGWATFFGWFKMFEYLRITESFAIMFFIIVGMINKVGKNRWPADLFSLGAVYFERE